MPSEASRSNKPLLLASAAVASLVLFWTRRRAEAVNTVGVSLRVLQFLAKRAKDERGASDPLKTRDVCKKIVEPMTKAQRCSFADLIVTGELKGLDETDVGDATHFCSHAWGDTFESFISALESRPDLSVNDRLWVDIAVVNQHTNTTRGFDWWSTTFKESVRKIGHTILVLSPWDEPKCLTRAWCLWEIFCTFDTATPLTAVVSDAGRESFVEAMSNWKDVTPFLQKIDVKKAKAWSTEDQKNIHDHVKATPGGFQRVNNKIASAYRDVLLRLARSMAGTTSEDEYTLHGLATALRKMKRYPEATEVQMQVLKGYRAKFGDDNAKTLSALANLASLERRQKRFEASCAHLTEAISGYKSLPGHEHSILKCKSSLASVWLDQGKTEEARTELKKILPKLEKHYGADHRKALTFVYNLAHATLKLSMLKPGQERRDLLAEAREGFERVKREYDMPDKDISPGDRLRVENALALVLVEEGNYADARERFHFLITEHEKLDGPKHDKVLEAKLDLAIVEFKDKKQTDAVELYWEVAEVFAERYPGPEGGSGQAELRKWILETCTQEQINILEALAQNTKKVSG